MTTSTVMTVTDELLAELEDAASNATQEQWELLPGTNISGPEIIANGESIAWVLDSEADAVHIATANPSTITALTTELRRLRAENAEMAKDAGRYRWLAWISDTQPFCVYECSTGQVLFGVRADTAIDTAMAAK